MVQPIILEKLEKLPEPLQFKVLQYIDSLIEEQNRGLGKMEEGEKPIKRGGFGIWKDKIWIADDFDEPLEDLKEYMSWHDEALKDIKVV